MLSAFATTHVLRTLTAQMLLVVFVCLGLVPTGFMPAFSADGTSFTICAGLDQRNVTFDDQGQPVHDATGKLCNFALNVGTAPSVKPLVIPSPVFDVVTLTLASQDARLHDQSSTNTHGPRAPPTA